jgi:carbonic anhydrase/acetyltransferase-like protein (isoleucine patch superfamily)
MIKKILRKLLYGNHADSRTLIRHLQKIGVSIDLSSTFFDAPHTHIDEQYPFLISIGRNVNISSGCSFYCHDYSWSVIKAKYGNLFGASGKITIDDNVFLGANCIILRNVSIGKNSIVGSGSVVVNDIPSEEIWAGNPAHFICKLSDFYQKRKAVQLDEAYNLFLSYYCRYKALPSENVFFEYIGLFSDFSDKKKRLQYIDRLRLMGNEEVTTAVALSSKPIFHSFSEMINHFSAVYSGKENL